MPCLLFAWIDQGCSIVEELPHPKIAPLITECERIEIDVSPHGEGFRARPPPRTVIFLLDECYGPSAIEWTGRTP